MLTPSTLNLQGVGVAGQKPTVVGLLAVYGHTMAGEVRRRAAGAWVTDNASLLRV